MSESTGSPIGEVQPSARIMRLYQRLEQVESTNGIPGYPPPPAQNTYIPGPQPHPYSFASQGFPGQGQAMIYSASGQGSAGLAQHISPATDSGRSGTGSRGNGASPEGSAGRPSAAQSQSSMSSGPGPSTGNASAQQRLDDILETPHDQDQGQMLYSGDIPGSTPIFAEAPAWLTEGTTVPISMYHRKSSDGATLRLMVEALSSNNVLNNGNGNSDASIQILDADAQDPLDTSPRLDTQSKPLLNNSPFGTLVVPPDSQNRKAKTGVKGVKNQDRLGRRSTTIRPQWRHAPKILVVEDDMVYRQLSSKFLEKFGCEIETVEDAHQAVQKMNGSK
jgi:osomolarity two-component system response regulator SKN7